MVVEPQEYDDYANNVDPAKILKLPFSNLGLGSIPARNFVWEHAKDAGAGRHWILDDNIQSFYRLYRNEKIRIQSPVAFRAIEDWVDRYRNVAMAGMQYEMFAPRRSPDVPPLQLNTRVYSCILLDNDLFPKYAWRGKYNEDTDLSLRLLKSGFCTALFSAFLANKVRTMHMAGGNTDALYSETDGRRKMAESLAEQHPDVTKVVWKWGRWQHHVDYRPFSGNRLIKRKNHMLLFNPDPSYGLILTEA
jgi:hypothetical protein